MFNFIAKHNKLSAIMIGLLILVTNYYIKHSSIIIDKDGQMISSK